MKRNNISTSTNTAANKKQAAFDEAFAKYASKLPQEYKDQFKRTEFTGPSKKTKMVQALRTGKNIEVVAKNHGNKKNVITNVGKLLDEETKIELKEVPKIIAAQVQKLRAEKNLSQEQFAKLISEKTSVVKDLENGDGIYDPKVVVKIENQFKVTFERPKNK